MQLSNHQSLPISLSRTLPVIALLLAIGGHIFFLSAWYHLSPKIETPPHRYATSNFIAHLSNIQTINLEKPFSTAKEKANKLPAKGSQPHIPANENIAIAPSQKNETYYFKSNEVSEKAQVIADLSPDFSLPELPEFLQPLIMTLRINTKGEVEEVLIASNVIDNNASQAIINAFKGMKFEAAKISNTAVSSELQIEVWGNQAP